MRLIHGNASGIENGDLITSAVQALQRVYEGSVAVDLDGGLF